MKRMLSLCLGGALLLAGGLSHADGMDGISAASPLAHEESVSTAAAKVMEPLPMEELLALMPESRGFLGEGDLPHGMTFTPFHLSADPHPCAGLLFLPGKKQDASVIAFGMEMKGEAAEAYFHDMFLPEGFTPEAGQRMLHFNIGLMEAETMLNNIFLQTAKGTREATGEPVPYDLMGVSMVHVEQLHKVLSQPKTYGFALSPYLVADGWAIPLYMRGFLTKTGEGYRSLLFLGFQSQKDALDQASYEILRSMK